MDSDDWLNADDDQWEKNWKEQVGGSQAESPAAMPVLSAATAAPRNVNPNDFESYNPLSKVSSKSTSKPKSNDDELWDMLNN